MTERPNQGVQPEAHAASPGFGENTDVTNYHNFLKYGGMTHHLSYHLLKTQDRVENSRPEGPTTEGGGEHRPREKTAARPEPRLRSPEREGRRVAPGSRPGALRMRGARGRARAGRHAGGGGTAAGAAAPGRRGRARRQVPDGRGQRGSGGRRTQGGRREAGESRAERGRAAGSPPAYLEVTGFP